MKSISLCKLLDEHLADSKDAKSGSKKVTSKVTSSDIHAFNHDLVHACPEPSRRCKKLLRHGRIHQMMDDGMISDGNCLSHYVRHFEGDRKKELEQKSQSRRKVNLPDACDKEYLEKHFKD